MANLKKYFRIFIVVTVLLLIFSLNFYVIKGNSDKKQIKLIGEQMTKYNNYTLIIKANIESNNYSQIISDKIVLQTNIDAQNNKYYLKLKFNDSDSEIYGEKDFERYITYEYMEDIDKWKKNESEYGIITAKKIGNMLQRAKNVHRIKSDFDGLKKYSVDLDLNYIIPFSLTSTLDDVLSIDKIKFNNDVKAFIYVNDNNQVEQIKLDLFNYLKNEGLLENSNLTRLDITLNFSQINESEKVEISDNIRNNLYMQNDKKMDDMNFDVDEKTIMNSIIIASAGYCKNTTIDFAKYNGELDDYVNHKEYFQHVSKGLININDSCDVEVIEDLIIDEKKCSYSDYGNIYCK
ncbi:MAG: hypothetical protein IJR82_01035 [Bacilli bacterium]|nr:hypothetical protein [Bacilli bacterium]